jgi:hypothetical protein
MDSRFRVAFAGMTGSLFRHSRGSGNPWFSSPERMNERSLVLILLERITL